MLTTEHSVNIRITEFAKDTEAGLSAQPKRLSSKYFYDKVGDKLFQDIMHMPEYYLTDSEFEIFETQGQNILDFAYDSGFDLIELGAGDGLKTKLLLNELVKQNADFQYIPIDISSNALEGLESDLNVTMPQVKVKPMQGDYFAILEKLKGISSRNKLVLFLGSNIGNFTKQEAKEFLCGAYDALSSGDRILLGVDLKKDPAIIQNAYDDAAGITASFNLNLLSRMNKELGADFDLSAFKHWETYDPVSGETKSYIVSKKDQEVYFSHLEKSFSFEAWEGIWVELSQKYSLSEIEKFANDCGFVIENHFLDSKKYYTNTMLRVQ